MMTRALYIAALLTLLACAIGCETRFLRIGKAAPVAVPIDQGAAIEWANRQHMATQGRWAFSTGLAILIGGGALSLAFKVYLPRKLGDVIYYGGAGIALYGLIMMESSKRLHIIGFVIIIVCGGLLLWKLKHKGIGREARHDKCDRRNKSGTDGA